MEHNCTREDRIKHVETELCDIRLEMKDLPTMRHILNEFVVAVKDLNNTNQMFQITLTKIDLNLLNLNEDSQETKKALKKIEQKMEDNENKSKVDTRDVIKNFIFYVLSPSCLVGFIIYTISTKIGG